MKRYIRTMIPAMLAAAVLTSCDKVIYDYEGDCSSHYEVKFRYDYNMKWADAFSHEVESVTLFLADGDGNVVWSKTESGEALAREDYRMKVDVDPGRYRMLAWCGTRDMGSFLIPAADMSYGVKGDPDYVTPTMKVQDLTCSLDCKRDNYGQAYMDAEMDRLFHGNVIEQEFPAEPGTRTFDMPLIKNTNSVRVVLQRISGDRVDSNRYTFKITSSDGHMDWDNSLLGDEEVTYYAWRVEESQTEVNFDREIYSAAVAECTIGRLVIGRDTRLTISSNETGRTILSIPIIDYALMVKGNYARKMEDQEYLDRQDEYNFVFFLDDGDRWMNSCVYINSWRVVFQNIEM